MKRQWLHSFHGSLKGKNPLATAVYFSAEDLGSAVSAAAPAPFVPQAWTFRKNGQYISMTTSPDGRVAVVSDYEDCVDGTYTKDEARTTWNALIADGWTIV
jgi:hypothetical protein